MRLDQISFAFALVQVCHAQDPRPPQWAIHESCVDIPGGLQVRTILINGFKDAINMARVASEVMKESKSNPEVDAMCKLVLGTKDYDNAYKKAQDTFDAIAAFPNRPFDGDTDDTFWEMFVTSRDVELHCDLSSFEVKGKEIRDKTRPQGDGTSSLVRQEEYDMIKNCQDIGFRPGPGVGASRAITRKAVDLDGKVRADWINIMHVCKWIMSSEAARGKPNLDTTDRLDWARSDEIRAKLGSSTAEVDLLKTIGTTILHELTHTVAGGMLQDVPEKSPATGEVLRDARGRAIKKCYGWFNAIRLQDVNNSDSIALLAASLKIWKLAGYRVERDGKLKLPGE